MFVALGVSVYFSNLEFDDTVWTNDFEDNGFSAIIKIGSTQVGTINQIGVTHETSGANRWIAATPGYYEFTVSSSITNQPLTIEFNYYNDPSYDADVLEGSGFAVKGIRSAEFEYDHHNRLVHYEEYSDESGTLLQSIDYIYDVFGQLIGRERDLPAAGDDFEYYVNDRGQRVLTVKPDDIANPTDYRVTRRKLWDQAVDQLLASEASDYDVSNHETYWPLTDHQGTVRHIYSISGYTDKAEHTKYDAFGRPDLVASSTDGTAEWYVDSFHAGREYDKYTGLYYNRARWYDPESGRFLSEGNNAGTNGYSYGGNSPTVTSDSNGNGVQDEPDWTDYFWENYTHYLNPMNNDPGVMGNVFMVGKFVGWGMVAVGGDWRRGSERNGACRRSLGQLSLQRQYSRNWRLLRQERHCRRR